MLLLHGEPQDDECAGDWGLPRAAVAQQQNKETGLSLGVSQAKGGEPPALDPPLWTADLHSAPEGIRGKIIPTLVTAVKRTLL